jgi:pilus assembly protein CpaB
VSARTRRRRALVLVSLSIASGGLAASHVRARVQAVERSVGPLVPVVAAAQDLPAEAKLRTRDLEVRRVPRRFAPPDALTTPAEAVGLRTAAPLGAGAYVTAGQVEGGGGRPPSGAPLRRGERAVEVAVAGGQALAAAGLTGTRVDVLISSEPRDGEGRTMLALENVELLGLREGTAMEEGASAERASPSARATLRVTLRQAVFLTAAQNFAREVRLLPRPPGDGRRLGRAAIAAGEL